MAYNGLIKKRCKCSIVCDYFPTTSFAGYYIHHCPPEVLNKLEGEKKKKEQRKIGKVIRGIRKEQQDEGVIDSIQELTIDLDRIVSRYIRIRDMEKDGKITCYICGKRVNWQKAHAMHFVNRQHVATRFLLQNLRVGCYDCNVIGRGELIRYAIKLNEEEKGLAEWLTEQGYTIKNQTRNELKELLFDFQQKLNIIEKIKIK